LPGASATVAVTAITTASVTAAQGPTSAQSPIGSEARAVPSPSPGSAVASPSNPQAPSSPSSNASSVPTIPLPPPSAGAAALPAIFRVAGIGDADAATPRLTIVGTVTTASAAPAAATLVETPVGLLAVAPRLSVPSGTLLLLDLPGALPVVAAGTSDQSAVADKNWPALAPALATLSHAAPTLAAQLQGDLSAQGGDRLAAALLYLVATLRGDERAAWPGDAVTRTLAEAGRDDLAKALGDTVGDLRQLAAAPATAPWQVFVLPVLDGALLRPVRLYLKRRGDERRRSADGDDNARFVLEFELSRFGTLQLDGFVRRKRFDLALRSRAPLAPTLQGEVTRIFNDRIAAAGLSGNLEFAVVAQFPVAPLDNLRDHVGFAV
jgi:hypothetical protein